MSNRTGYPHDHPGFVEAAQTIGRSSNFGIFDVLSGGQMLRMTLASKSMTHVISEDIRADVKFMNDGHVFLRSHPGARSARLQSNARLSESWSRTRRSTENLRWHWTSSDKRWLRAGFAGAAGAVRTENVREILAIYRQLRKPRKIVKTMISTLEKRHLCRQSSRGSKTSVGA